MIIVHDIFICKPGNASKFAKMCKESATPGEDITVMTDMVGQFNKVVMVSKYKTLADYEKSFDAYMNPTPEMKESMAKMSGYQEMYLTGSREIYRTW